MRIDELLEQAENYFDENEYDCAKACYLDILSLDSSHYEARYKLAIIAYNQGVLDDAYQYCAKLLIDNSTLVHVHYLLGDVFHAMNSLEDAIVSYSHAINQGLRTAYVFKARGIANAKNGQNRYAIQDFIEVITIDPSFKDEILDAIDAFDLIRDYANNPISEETASPSGDRRKRKDRDERFDDDDDSPKRHHSDETNQNRQAIAALTTEFKELRDRNFQLETMLFSLQTQLDAANAKIDSTTNFQEEDWDKIQTLSQQQNKMQRELTDLTTTVVDELAVEMTKHKAAVEAKTEAHQTAIDELLLPMKGLQSQVAKLCAQVTSDQVPATVAAHGKAIGDNETKMNALTSKVDELVSNMVKNATITALLDTLKEFFAEVKGINDRILSLSQDQQNDSTVLEYVSIQADQLSKQLDNLNTQINGDQIPTAVGKELAALSADTQSKLQQLVTSMSDDKAQSTNAMSLLGASIAKYEEVSTQLNVQMQLAQQANTVMMGEVKSQQEALQRQMASLTAQVASEQIPTAVAKELADLRGAIGATDAKVGVGQKSVSDLQNTVAILNGKVIKLADKEARHRSTSPHFFGYQLADEAADFRPMLTRSGIAIVRAGTSSGTAPTAK